MLQKSVGGGGGVFTWPSKQLQMSLLHVADNAALHTQSSIQSTELALICSDHDKEAIALVRSIKKKRH